MNFHCVRMNQTLLLLLLIFTTLLNTPASSFTLSSSQHNNRSNNIINNNTNKRTKTYSSTTPSNLNLTPEKQAETAKNSAYVASALLRASGGKTTATAPALDDLERRNAWRKENLDCNNTGVDGGAVVKVRVIRQVLPVELEVGELEGLDDDAASSGDGVSGGGGDKSLTESVGVGEKTLILHLPPPPIATTKKPSLFTRFKTRFFRNAKKEEEELPPAITDAISNAVAAATAAEEELEARNASSNEEEAKKRNADYVKLVLDSGVQDSGSKRFRTFSSILKNESGGGSAASAVEDAGDAGDGDGSVNVELKSSSSTSTPTFATLLAPSGSIQTPIFSRSSFALTLTKSSTATTLPPNSLQQTFMEKLQSNNPRRQTSSSTILQKPPEPAPPPIPSPPFVMFCNSRDNRETFYDVCKDRGYRRERKGGGKVVSFMEQMGGDRADRSGGGGEDQDDINFTNEV